MLYKITNLEHSYGEKIVLQVPSFTVSEGEIFAIVGPSGAGKSTLLRLLGLLEAPSNGEVCLCVEGNYVSYKTVSINNRRQIGTVFQRSLLLSRSVKDNVAYGLRLRGEYNGHNRVYDALNRVALLPLQDAYPNTLSGGEIQRVAIARSVVLEPRILLLDEPTANLDPYNIRLIEDILVEQCEVYKTTIVLVTHDIFQAKRLATQVALIVNGQLVETGPTEKIFNRPADPRTVAFLSGELIG